MKRWIILMVTTTLFISGIFTSSSENDDSEEPLRDKEKLRLRLKSRLHQFTLPGIEESCSKNLTAEQIVFGDQKLYELNQCGNATIDIFADKLDDNVTFNNPKSYGKVVGPVCEVFDNMFSCISDFNPVIDMCLVDSLTLLKNKLFKIVPLIQQSTCLRKGALVAEIIEHEDGYKCMIEAFYTLIGVGFIEVFNSNSTELFGDGKVCDWFGESLQKFYGNIGQCSGDILDKVKDMFGFFCEHTQCERYVDDLQCY